MQLLKMVLVGVHQVHQLAVLRPADQVRVVVDQLYLNPLALALLAVDLALDHLQLLRAYHHLAVVHEQLLVAPAWTREKTAQRLQVLLADLYARFLLDFRGCHSHEIAALVDHSRRRLEQSGLDWHSILLDKQDFVVDEHEDGDRVSPQKDVARQFVPVLLSDGPHVDKADLVAEHLHP